jgi:tRNA(Arg) A34 adenosine deaminase TadA
MCLSAAYWAKIVRITYGANHMDAAAAGFNDAYIYGELRKELSHRRIVMQQLLRNNALHTFKLWEEMEEKIIY